MQTVGMIVRVLCVFALLGATLWVLSRMDGRAGKGRKKARSTSVQVTASARLAKGASVSVVRVGDVEYVLGVTETAVNLLSSVGLPAAPVEVPVEVAPATGRRPDFAALLKARLGRTPAGPATAAEADPASASHVPVAPTASEFLANSWRVARGRALDRTTVSNTAVQAALAAVSTPAQHAPLTAPDGSAAPITPAPGRSTDARPAQEPTWSPPASTSLRSEEAFVTT